MILCLERDLHDAVLGYKPDKSSFEYGAVEKLVELHWHVRRLGQLRILVLQVGPR